MAKLGFPRGPTVQTPAADSSLMWSPTARRPRRHPRLSPIFECSDVETAFEPHPHFTMHFTTAVKGGRPRARGARESVGKVRPRKADKQRLGGRTTGATTHARRVRALPVVARALSLARLARSARAPFRVPCAGSLTAAGPANVHACSRLALSSRQECSRRGPSGGRDEAGTRERRRSS